MHYDPEYLLKRFTDHFKQKYKVECISALHHNKRKTNYHIHLIFAERQLLDKPVEKIATRNMFYDEMGKHRRTKKEILDEAGNIRKRCRVVRKGEMYERKLFTKKNELFKADIYYNPAQIQQQSLFDSTDNIKEDRTPEDLLFQVMLDLGILLSSKIEEKTIAGKKVFNVADGFLIACFDNDVTEKTVKAVAQEKPYYAVFRDSSMANDSVATNFEQIFATYSPETVRKVL